MDTFEDHHRAWELRVETLRRPPLQGRTVVFEVWMTPAGFPYYFQTGRCVMLAGKRLPYRFKITPKIHRVGADYAVPHLDWYQYFVRSLATGRVFIHEQQFVSYVEFRKAIVRWNAALPDLWHYEEAVL